MRSILLVLVTGCLVQPPLPPTRPATNMVVTRPVDGIEVLLVPSAVSGWTITIRNQRDEGVNVVWDESSFVASDEISRGRLLRGETRLMDSAKTQPASPLAPRSTLQEFVIPEQLAGVTAHVEPISEAPSDPDACATKRRACKGDSAMCMREHQECMSPTSHPTHRSLAPPAVTRGVGRMVVALDGKRGPEIWEAAISFDGSPLPRIAPVAKQSD